MRTRETWGGTRAQICTIFAAILLTACAETKRVVEHLPTPPERLICERAGTRPTIPPEAVVAWERITNAGAAKVALDAYVASVRAREAVVADYVLNVEGKLERCAINMDWRRDYEKGL